MFSIVCFHLLEVKFSFADCINVQAENNKVETVLLNGKRFDCGIFLLAC